MKIAIFTFIICTLTFSTALSTEISIGDDKELALKKAKSINSYSSKGGVLVYYQSYDGGGTFQDYYFYSSSEKKYFIIRIENEKVTVLFEGSGIHSDKAHHVDRVLNAKPLTEGKLQIK